MINSFKKLKKETIIPYVLLLACTATLLFRSELWSNILSPINSCVSAAILLVVYCKSNSKTMNTPFLFYSFAGFSWAIADTLWLIYSLMDKNPENNITIILFYTIPNLMIFLAVYLFILRQFRKWNFIQLCIDVFFVSCCSLLLVWETFLHKDVLLLYTMIRSDVTSVFSIAFNIFIGIGILTWFLSIRYGNIPAFVRIIFFGVLLYIAVDMLYYYLYFNGRYTANALIDITYLLSFQIIAFGALWNTNLSSGVSELLVVKNEGNISKWVYMSLFPLAAVFLWITKLFSTSISLLDMALYAFLILLYRASCKYVQISIENERLLEHEKHINVMLEQRVTAQVSKLSFLENQDPLTSLFNRRYFMSCLDNAIAAKLDSDLLSVILIDIDRFKTINDSFGHDIGDKVLIEFSSRITKWNHCCSTIARLGGDEFSLIIIGKYSRNEIENFCKEIIDLFSQPVSVGFDSLQITISLGAALYSSDANTSTELLKKAEIAMYRAKSQGYNKYQFYEPFFNEQINKNNEIERLLRKANINKDFELFYQPQFSIPDLKLIGAEALIRWKTAEYGYIPPNEFIPIAEEIDFISDIGKWVMCEAIRQGAIWNKEHGLQLRIGVNISAKQLVEETFTEALEDISKEESFNPDWIDAEITESIMISDKSKVQAIFSLFRSLGISVSIDDFGSGYASFRYLTELSFDRIKIDKSLIDEVSKNNISTVQVVNAIITMAKALGVRTIAEGVETKEQLDILIELGCDEIQGYLLGRPVPSEIFETRYINYVNQSLNFNGIS